MERIKQTYLAESVKKRILFIFLIIAAGFSVYFNSLDSDFIWDDEILVRDNPYIRSWSGVKDVFTKDIGTGYGKRYEFYRPIQMLTYIIDYSFGGLNVRAYHITNTLLHILVALAIFWLINILYSNQLVSFLASIFFITHPVHTEAVTYISGRADLLASLFILLSFITYLKYTAFPSKVNFAISILAYVFAIFSKELSLILPAIIILYHNIFKKKVKLNLFLSLLAITFVYLVCRLAILGPFERSFFSNGLYARIIGFFAAISDYVRLLILPFNFHMEYGNKIFTLANHKVIFGAIISSFLLVAAFRYKTNKRSLSFAIFWFFLTLLPQSNIYPVNAYMAEHWLYLPSVGYFLIISECVAYVRNSEKLKFLAIVFVSTTIIFYSFLTIKQNIYWKNPVAFYERNLKFNPNSPRLLNNLALKYKNEGNYNKAIALYKRAIEFNPSYVEAFNNLGVLYTTMRRFDEAIILYKRAIEIKPDYTKAYNNLGTVYRETGQCQQAIDCYKKAIEINPDYFMAYYNLGNTFQKIGNTDEAIIFYKKTISINPHYSAAYNDLSMLYHKKGEYVLSIAYYDKAIKLGHKVEPEFRKIMLRGRVSRGQTKQQ